MSTRMQKVQRNGMITIPKEMRERAKIYEGDYIETELQPDGIFIRVVNVHRTYRKLEMA